MNNLIVYVVPLYRLAWHLLSLSAASAYLIFGLFFQPEQCFSLTTIQPEQCFPASFSQDSVNRTGPKRKNWRNNKWAKISSVVWKDTRIVKYHQKFSSWQIPTEIMNSHVDVVAFCDAPQLRLEIWVLDRRLDCHGEPEAGGGGVREAARATRTACCLVGRRRFSDLPW